MSDDIYKAPEASLDAVTEEEHVLASRWRRFFGSMLDSILITIISMVVTAFFVGSGQFITFITQPSNAIILSSSFTFWFLILNGYLLITSQQTLAKRLLGMKIVSNDGTDAVWNKHLVKRYAVFLLLPIIPVIGNFLSLINIVFIFNRDKRCVHDLAGDTRVVRC